MTARLDDVRTAFAQHLNEIARALSSFSTIRTVSSAMLVMATACLTPGNGGLKRIDQTQLRPASSNACWLTKT